MDLESTKNLGGIGAILIAIGGFGVLGTGYAGLLALIGIILVLISLKGLADHYGEGGIFNNALYALVMIVVGVVACGGIFVFSLLNILADWGITTTEDWANIGTILTERLANMDTLLEFVGAIILAWVVLFIFVLLATLFLRNSMNSLSKKTGVGMFGTAGILMLIGGLLFIILIGAILILIAWILVAVAFFSIRPQPTQPQQPPPPAPA